MRIMPALDRILRAACHTMTAQRYPVTPSRGRASPSPLTALRGRGSAPLAAVRGVCEPSDLSVRLAWPGCVDLVVVAFACDSGSVGDGDVSLHRY
jgi:hypothetical protein